MSPTLGNQSATTPIIKDLLVGSHRHNITILHHINAYKVLLLAFKLCNTTRRYSVFLILTHQFKLILTIELAINFCLNLNTIGLATKSTTCPNTSPNGTCSFLMDVNHSFPLNLHIYFCSWDIINHKTTSSTK